MKLPKLQTLKIAPNCVKLAEIAPNYPKLQKKLPQIASNCVMKILNKFKKLHASTQKIAEIGRNCLKLPPIA